MSRPSEGTATAGHDARWPIRAYRVAQHIRANGPCSRDNLLAVAIVVGVGRMLAEDTICAMENDGIVEVAPLRHLTLSERRQARGGTVVKLSRGLRLSAKGERFVDAHQQHAELGTCSCWWCVDLAEIRAWAAETPPGEQQRILGSLASPPSS